MDRIYKEKEGFKHQVRFLTNALNKMKHKSISFLQEPLIGSFEILGIISGIQEDIKNMKVQNENFQTGDEGAPPTFRSTSFKGSQLQS